MRAWVTFYCGWQWLSFTFSSCTWNTYCAAACIETCQIKCDILHSSQFLPNNGTMCTMRESVLLCLRTCTHILQKALHTVCYWVALFLNILRIKSYHILCEWECICAWDAMIMISPLSIGCIHVWLCQMYSLNDELIVSFFEARTSQFLIAFKFSN